MNKTLLILFSLFATVIYSQDVNRITVDGKIIVSSADKEGVTVFNSSSNKGTFTDENGDFKINVAVNDIVEFSSLQFKDFTVKVTDNIMETKQMTVILVEEVNKLPEVVLLPFGLTGEIDADLANVRTYNADLDAIYFGLENVEDFEFSADYKTEAENLAFNEYHPRVENMINVVNLAGFIYKQVSGKTTTSKTDKEKALERSPFQKALDQYSINYIHVNFNIPREEVPNFVNYVENQGIDKELLEDDKELQFLERINELSKSFLKQKSDKN